MPGERCRKRPANDFDVSVDEGTFGDYEAFGVFTKDQSGEVASEYEIFIVSTGQEV